MHFCSWIRYANPLTTCIICIWIIFWNFNFWFLSTPSILPALEWELLRPSLGLKLLLCAMCRGRWLLPDTNLLSSISFNRWRCFGTVFGCKRGAPLERKEYTLSWCTLTLIISVVLLTVSYPPRLQSVFWVMGVSEQACVDMLQSRN